MIIRTITRIKNMREMGRRKVGKGTLNSLRTKDEKGEKCICEGGENIIAKRNRYDIRVN